MKRCVHIHESAHSITLQIETCCLI